MRLRDYQQETLDAVMRAFWEHGKRSALIVLPTGAGKTVVFGTVIHRWPPMAGRVMVLAHREELIRQAADKIERVTGEACAIEMANEWSFESGLAKPARVVVSTVQTQLNRKERFSPSDFSLVIVDEAHHAPSDSYQKVLEHYRQNPKLKVLGVTATPDRTDEMAMGKVFDCAPAVYEMPDIINRGYLVAPRMRSVFIDGLDYSGVKTTAGDCNQKDVAEAQSSADILQAFAAVIAEHTRKRKTLIFATPGFAGSGNDKHRIAERLATILEGHLPGNVRRIHQKTPKPERRAIIEDYANGVFTHLVNVGVLTEGFDDPTIESIVITRPTKSRALYAQMIGRGTRPLPGLVDQLDSASDRIKAIARSSKPVIDVIDFRGNVGNHDLVGPIDVLGGDYSDEVVERARRIARKKEKAGESVNVMDLLGEAAHIVEEEHRKALSARVKYSQLVVDPFELGVKRERYWNEHPTEKQIAFLKEKGVNAIGMDKRQASAIIDKFMQRSKAGLCGPKLAAQLRARGMNDKVTTGQALQMLTSCHEPA